MNLVSYEYIACQQEKQGVMVISEFAGAAQSLNGSIVVNPWDSQQVADAIFEALTMDAETRAENHRKLFKYVNKYSAAFWGTSFVREMTKLATPEQLATAGKGATGKAEKGGQAELTTKEEDAKGSVIIEGSVPPTPAANAPV